MCVVPSPLALILGSYKAEDHCFYSPHSARGNSIYSQKVPELKGQETLLSCHLLSLLIDPDCYDLECVHKATSPSHLPHLLAGLRNSLGEPRERCWG